MREGHAIEGPKTVSRTEIQQLREVNGYIAKLNEGLLEKIKGQAAQLKSMYISYSAIVMEGNYFDILKADGDIRAYKNQTNAHIVRYSEFLDFVIQKFTRAIHRDFFKTHTKEEFVGGVRWSFYQLHKTDMPVAPMNPTEGIEFPEIEFELAPLEDSRAREQREEFIQSMEQWIEQLDQEAQKQHNGYHHYVTFNGLRNGLHGSDCNGVNDIVNGRAAGKVVNGFV